MDAASRSKSMQYDGGKTHCGGWRGRPRTFLERVPTETSGISLGKCTKGTSSRLLRKERPDIASRYWKGVLWSPSYFVVSAGGAPLEKVKAYVENQRASHKP